MNSSTEFLQQQINKLSIIIDSISAQMINQTKILSSLLEKCRYCKNPAVTMTHMHLEHIRACDSCAAKLIHLSTEQSENIESEEYNDWVEVELAKEIRQTKDLSQHLKDVLNEQPKKVISS